MDVVRGDEREQGRLKVASRRRALRLGAAIVFQVEKGELAGLIGPPGLKLLAAEFRNPLPAKGVAVDDDGVGLRHDTSRGIGLGGRLRLQQAIEVIRRALRMG